MFLLAMLVFLIYVAVGILVIFYLDKDGLSVKWAEEAPNQHIVFLALLVWPVMAHLTHYRNKHSEK